MASDEEMGSLLTAQSVITAGVLRFLVESGLANGPKLLAFMETHVDQAASSIEADGPSSFRHLAEMILDGLRSAIAEPPH